MRTQTAFKSTAPSKVSLLQDQIRSNNQNCYRAFLYSEATRHSKNPVNLEEINQFINSPEGQRGLALFISFRPPSKEITRPQCIGTSLNSFGEKLKAFGAEQHNTIEAKPKNLEQNNNIGANVL